jgi:hypothetical protein
MLLCVFGYVQHIGVVSVVVGFVFHKAFLMGVFNSARFTQQATPRAHPLTYFSTAQIAKHKIRNSMMPP